MSGVWVFKNGVVRLVDPDLASSQPTKKKVLIHWPTDEVVSSHSSLEQIPRSLGWERYYGGDPGQLHYHKRGCLDLISLLREFSELNSVQIYDIVIKNRDSFRARDATE